MPDQLICKYKWLSKAFLHAFLATSSPSAVSISFSLLDGFSGREQDTRGISGEANGGGFLMAPVTLEVYQYTVTLLTPSISMSSRTRSPGILPSVINVSLGLSTK